VVAYINQNHQNNKKRNQIIQLEGVFMPEHGFNQTHDNNNHSNSYDTNGGSIQPVDVPHSVGNKIPAENDGLT
jgi:hypothetical protein